MKKPDKSVPLSFIIENPDRRSILRAVVDRELDRLRCRRLAAWFDYLESRAHLGAPSREQIERLAEMKASRDVLVHNRGIVNPTYLLKAGSQSRYADGARLEITQPYLREGRLLLTDVVRETSARAIARLDQA